MSCGDRSEGAVEDRLVFWNVECDSGSIVWSFKVCVFHIWFAANIGESPCRKTVIIMRTKSISHQMMILRDIESAGHMKIRRQATTSFAGIARAERFLKRATW
jgi:hypothetical protein